MENLTFKLPDGFRFEEAGHSYWIGSTQIPGVTETIARCGLYPFPTRKDEDATGAMLRGWVVHQALDAWYKGQLQDVDPGIAGYILSEKIFVESTGFRMLASEVPICNSLLFYGCTPDRFGILNNRLVMLDSKTGAECAAYHVQLIANYTAALTLGIPLEGAYLLELKADGGRPRLIPLANASEHYEVFLKALGCLKWRKKNVGYF